jgi:hypothetical protein
MDCNLLAVYYFREKVVLVYGGINLQPSFTVFRLVNKVKPLVSSLMLLSILRVSIINPIIMIVPNSNYLCTL